MRLDRGIAQHLVESINAFKIIRGLELVAYDEGVNLFGCIDQGSKPVNFHKILTKLVEKFL